MFSLAAAGMTPEGVSTPRKVAMRSTNAPSFFFAAVVVGAVTPPAGARAASAGSA